MAEVSNVDQSVKVVMSDGRPSDYLVSLLDNLTARVVDLQTISENLTNEEQNAYLMARIHELEKRVAALEP